MLGYVILVHYRPQAVFELLEALYSEDDAYVVSIDGACDPLLVEELLWLQKFDNIRLLVNRGVNWASVSILDATLQGIRLLLDNFADVEYVINLSGECFPVKPRAELVAYLATHSGKSFIASGPVTDLGEDDAAASSIFASTEFSPISWPTGYQAVNLLEVPSALFTKGKTRLVGDPLFHLSNLAHDARRRLFYMNSDIVAQRMLYFSYPSQYFVLSREHFAKKYSGYWHQSAWCVLSREFCEFVFADELGFAVYDHVRNCLYPDETFFGTVIHNSPLRERHVNHSLTYANHARGIEIDEEDVPAIDQGEYFFARKFAERSASAKQRYRHLVLPDNPLRFCGWNGGADVPLCTRMFSHLVRNERAAWRFGRAFCGEPAHGLLRLASDGAILGYDALDGWSWQLDAAARRLEFRNAAGVVTIAFSSFALSRNGKVYLFGGHDQDRGGVHYLESGIAEHFRQAAGVKEAFGWLAELGRMRADPAAAGSDVMPEADEPTGFFDEGVATPEATAKAAAMPLRCRIDGRDRGSVPSDGVGDQTAPEWRLAPFGILVTRLFDLEFAVVSHGICGGGGKPAALFGVARDFTGKLCAVRLRSAQAGEPAAVEG